MDFEGRMNRTQSVAVLTEIVKEISANFDEPLPDGCWYEAAADAMADGRQEYGILLRTAAERFERIIEFECNQPRVTA